MTTEWLLLCFIDTPERTEISFQGHSCQNLSVLSNTALISDEMRKHLSSVQWMYIWRRKITSNKKIWDRYPEVSRIHIT